MAFTMCLHFLDALVSSQCELSRQPGICDNQSDDTATLQEAFDHCPLQGRTVVIHQDADCTSQPLNIRSNTDLLVQGHVRAGSPWNTSGTLLRDDGEISPFILAKSVGNVTVRGNGTIDGNGALWWHKIQPHRARLLAFINASSVRVDGVTLLNSAFWTLLLHGRDFIVTGIKVRAPDAIAAPNTDGIDIAAQNVYIRDVDIRSGDDSICIKSPSSNVLVEHSRVAQGNGLVVGTAADQQAWGGPWETANVENVTFRDIVADDTTFGCHIKYYFPQHGSVRNITFENINVYQTAAAEKRRKAVGDWAGYAIGIHQFDQGRRLLSAPKLPTFVRIEQILFRNITGSVLHAGQFECTRFGSPCKDIQLNHVHINASVDGCIFSEVQATASDVTPASCNPNAQWTK